MKTYFLHNVYNTTHRISHLKKNSFSTKEFPSLEVLLKCSNVENDDIKNMVNRSLEQLAILNTIVNGSQNSVLALAKQLNLNQKLIKQIELSKEGLSNKERQTILDNIDLIIPNNAQEISYIKPTNLEFVENFINNFIVEMEKSIEAQSYNKDEKIMLTLLTRKLTGELSLPSMTIKIVGDVLSRWNREEPFPSVAQFLSYCETTIYFTHLNYMFLKNSVHANVEIKEFYIKLSCCILDSLIRAEILESFIEKKTDSKRLKLTPQAMVIRESYIFKGINIPRISTPDLLCAKKLLSKDQNISLKYKKEVNLVSFKSTFSETQTFFNEEVIKSMNFLQNQAFKINSTNLNDIIENFESYLKSVEIEIHLYKNFNEFHTNEHSKYKKLKRADCDEDYTGQLAAVQKIIFMLGVGIVFGKRDLYFTVYIDFRGRCYYRGYGLFPLGDALSRSLLIPKSCYDDFSNYSSVDVKSSGIQILGLLLCDINILTNTGLTGNNDCDIYNYAHDKIYDTDNLETAVKKLELISSTDKKTRTAQQALKLINILKQEPNIRKLNKKLIMFHSYNQGLMGLQQELQKDSVFSSAYGKLETYEGRKINNIDLADRVAYTLKANLKKIFPELEKFKKILNHSIKHIPEGYHFTPMTEGSIVTSHNYVEQKEERIKTTHISYNKLKESAEFKHITTKMKRHFANAPLDLNKISTASVANIMHHLDATLLHKIVSQLEEAGIDCTARHDCWTVKTSNIQQLRNIYFKSLCELFLSKQTPMLDILNNLSKIKEAEGFKDILDTKSKKTFPDLESYKTIYLQRLSTVRPLCKNSLSLMSIENKTDPFFSRSRSFSTYTRSNTINNLTSQISFSMPLKNKATKIFTNYRSNFSTLPIKYSYKKLNKMSSTLDIRIESDTLTYNNLSKKDTISTVYYVIQKYKNLNIVFTINNENCLYKRNTSKLKFILKIDYKILDINSLIIDISNILPEKLKYKINNKVIKDILKKGKTTSKKLSNININSALFNIKKFIDKPESLNTQICIQDVNNKEIFIKHNLYNLHKLNVYKTLQNIYKKILNTFTSNIVNISFTPIKNLPIQTLLESQDPHQKMLALLLEESNKYEGFKELLVGVAPIKFEFNELNIIGWIDNFINITTVSAQIFCGLKDIQQDLVQTGANISIKITLLSTVDQNSIESHKPIFILIHPNEDNNTYENKTVSLISALMEVLESYTEHTPVSLKLQNFKTNKFEDYLKKASKLPNHESSKKLKKIFPSDKRYFHTSTKNNSSSDSSNNEESPYIKTLKRLKNEILIQLKITNKYNDTFYLNKINQSNNPNYSQRTYNYIHFADFETHTIDGVIKPYALGFTQHDIINEKTGKPSAILSYLAYKNIYITHKSPTVKDDTWINQAINLLLLGKENSIIYFHNFGRFDAFLILAPLFKIYKVEDIKVTERNNKIFEISILSRSISIRDSLLLLPIPLKDFKKAFNLKEGKKEINVQNLHSIYSSDLSTFLEYLHHDVTTLQEGFTCFRNLIIKDTDRSSLAQEQLNLFENTIFPAAILNQSNYELNILNKLKPEIVNIINQHYAPIDIKNTLTISSLSFRIFRNAYYSSFFTNHTHYFKKSKDKNIFPNYIIFKNKAKIDRFVRQAYMGGVVDVFKPIIKKGHLYDVNSLYPYAMLNDQPVGPGKFISFKNSDYNFNDLFGFFKAFIVSPITDIPFLPVKQTSLFNPIGFWTGTYFSEELKKAKKLGYTVVLIEGVSYKRGPVFNNFINHYYNKRLITPKSDPLNMVYKLLLNSLYGRFGMHLTPQRSKFISLSTINDDETLSFLLSSNLLEFNAHDIQTSSSTNDILLSAKFIENTDFLDESNLDLSINTAVHISAAITAYARIYMHDFKTIPNNQAIYTDTDSVVLQKKLNNKHVSNSTLGKFKHEGELIESYFVAPKCYMINFKDNSSKIAFKGLNKDQKISLPKDSFKNAILFQEKFKTSPRAFAPTIDFQNAALLDKPQKAPDFSIALRKRNKSYRNGIWIDTLPKVYKQPTFYDELLNARLNNTISQDNLNLIVNALKKFIDT